MLEDKLFTEDQIEEIREAYLKAYHSHLPTIEFIEYEHGVNHEGLGYFEIYFKNMKHSGHRWMYIERDPVLDDIMLTLESRILSNTVMKLEREDFEKVKNFISSLEA